MKPRYRGPPKRDANHRQIVAMFEGFGWLALDLAGVGGGAPDLLLYDKRRGKWLLVEVKDGAKKWTRHNPAVLARQAAFKALGWPVVTITNLHEAHTDARWL